VGRRDDVDVIGLYVERDWRLDGLAMFASSPRSRVTRKDVVFYKAGRTEVGRRRGSHSRVARPTCDAAAERAGAIVVDTFKS
jgi:acyl-CoA synthetase (NDP forming)